MNTLSNSFTMLFHPPLRAPLCPVLIFLCRSHCRSRFRALSLSEQAWVHSCSTLSTRGSEGFPWTQGTSLMPWCPCPVLLWLSALTSTLVRDPISASSLSLFRSNGGLNLAVVPSLCSFDPLFSSRERHHLLGGHGPEHHQQGEARPDVEGRCDHQRYRPRGGHHRGLDRRSGAKHSSQNNKNIL